MILLEPVGAHRLTRDLLEDRLPMVTTDQTRAEKGLGFDHCDLLFFDHIYIYIFSNQKIDENSERHSSRESERRREKDKEKSKEEPLWKDSRPSRRERLFHCYNEIYISKIIIISNTESADKIYKFKILYCWSM